MTSEHLDAARSAAAETEWLAYDLESYQSAGQDGWETTTLGDELARSIYVSRGGDDAPSERARFHVRFVAGTAAVAEAYASLDGTDIGRRGSTRDASLTPDDGHEWPAPTYRVSFADGTAITGLHRRQAALTMLTSGGWRPEVRGGAGRDTAARYELWLAGPGGERRTGVSVTAHGPREAYEQALWDAVNYTLNGCSVTAEVPPGRAGRP